MTPLARKVSRSVPAPRRALVVTLDPNNGDPILSIREKGRRSGYSVTLPGLFLMLARRDADNKLAAKRAARRSR